MVWGSSALRSGAGIVAAGLLVLYAPGASATADRSAPHPLAARIEGPGLAATGHAVRFTFPGTTVPAGDSVISFFIVFGDHSPREKRHGLPRAITHAYSHPGTYRATVTITDAHGRHSTATLLLRVVDVVFATPTVDITTDTTNITLHAGQNLQIRFGDLPWQTPISSDPRLLSLVSATTTSAGATAVATFLAHTRGTAHIHATTRYPCEPQCLPPDRLYDLSILIN